MQNRKYKVFPAGVERESELVDLIELKKKASRPKDIEDIAQLNKLREDGRD